MKKPKKITKAMLWKKQRKLEKRIVREKDDIWKVAVKERDSYICQLCLKQYQKGETGLHSHHIISRVFKEFRHDINNGISLCYYCHHKGPNSPHQNAIIFVEFLKTKKPELYEIAINNFRLLENKNFKTIKC